MLKSFDPSLFTFQAVDEAKGKASCLIPLKEEETSVMVEVRSEKEVDLSAVTVDGETLLLDHGRIVRWSGKLLGCSAVEIAADTGFWYLCRKSSGWFEKVDPTPMVVELVATKEDAIKVMIEERLAEYTRRMHLEREMTEEEKDELILDIARGDLEFDTEPDQFGLGYAERLEEFISRTAEQPLPAEPAPAPAPAAAPPAPAGGPATSTVPTT